MKKKAILTVSFGTSYAQTRKKTIEAIEQELKEAFREYSFYRAWTSGRILRKVKREEGLEIDTLDKALERIHADGITELLIQPTYMINGIENDRMLSGIREYADRFETIRVGGPLLSGKDDCAYLADALISIFSQIRRQELLLLMGHGTPGGDNSCYQSLNELLAEKGSPNMKIGLVEGKPGIEDLAALAKESSAERVYLAPFTIVAGDHALHDMSGEKEDSWQKILEREGFEVHCILRGMGEHQKIRALYVRHAVEAGPLKKEPEMRSAAGEGEHRA